ncbi:MAG: hypothetical protein JRG76_01890 [Deltaproteobacteria bacterium]|nr:hypothetical protein [Deltaproteobacteria bacterium]MBW2413236.1 hypothetical protein [Deltaproteobacteria bacterium]
MTEQAALDAWVPKFEAWKEEAVPQIMSGKAKEAFSRYPWFSEPGDPFKKLRKPARQARFGLVTTGGYSIEGEQEPFVPMPSFDDKTPELRTIPFDVDRSKLRIDHPGYDHRFAEQDINVNLPLDRLTELVQSGEIGTMSTDTQVLMGLVPNVVPLIRETIPTIVQRFVSDGVEAALLVPS